MGVDKRNHVFAPGLSPGWLGDFVEERLHGGELGKDWCNGFVWRHCIDLMKRETDENRSGNEVYYTACSSLVILQNSCMSTS